MSSGYDVIDCGAAFGVNREYPIVVAAIGRSVLNIWILPALQIMWR